MLDKYDYFLKRTAEHIARVKNNAMYLAKNIIDTDPKISSGLVMQVQFHDQSKFQEPEKTPYIEITDYYRHVKEGRDYEFNDKLNDDMNAATIHHINSNKHHPEYWCVEDCSDSINRSNRDAIPDKKVDGTNMDLVSIAEMCCDWCSMSQELGNSNSAHDWADKNVNKRWLFSEYQVTQIYRFLDILNTQ